MPLRGERGDERVRVGRDDADERAVLALAPRRGDGGSELVEPGEEAVDERRDVRLDRRHTDLRDQLACRRRPG